MRHLILPFIESVSPIKSLICYGAKVKEIQNLDKAENLEELLCSKNKLEALNLSASTALKVLDCSDNNISALDLSNDINLETLNVSGNNISDMSDFKLPEILEGSSGKIKNLKCGNNRMNLEEGVEKWDLSNYKALESLDCSDNEISDIEFPDSDDVGGSNKLVDLNCSGNQIESLDLSKCKHLEELWCDNNKMTSLDVSGNRDLMELSCTNPNSRWNLDKCKSLDTLILGDNDNLKSLSCGYNNLESLNISQNEELILLSCEDNKLESLDISDTKILLEDTVFDLGDYYAYFGSQQNVEGINVIMTGEQKELFDFYKDHWRNYKVTVSPKEHAENSPTMQVSPPKIFNLTKTSYSYDGKAKTPAVIVKDAKGRIISPTNYKVSYRDNKNVGTATAIIDFTSSKSYSCIKKLTFKINPAKTQLSSVSAGRKLMTVKWTKRATGITGYEIQYAKFANFKGANTSTVKKIKNTSLKIAGLKSGKKYFIRVRTYKQVGNKKYYSVWSNVKSISAK